MPTHLHFPGLAHTIFSIRMIVLLLLSNAMFGMPVIFYVTIISKCKHKQTYISVVLPHMLRQWPLHIPLLQDLELCRSVFHQMDYEQQMFLSNESISHWWTQLLLINHLKSYELKKYFVARNDVFNIISIKYFVE